MLTIFCYRTNCCRYSVTQSCPTLCDPMDCSTPGFPLFHYLLEFAQTPVHWIGNTIQPSHPLLPFFCLQSFPAWGSFPVSWLFKSGGQSIGASASALPVNIQSWFPLGLTINYIQLNHMLHFLGGCVYVCVCVCVCVCACVCVVKYALFVVVVAECFFRQHLRV